MSVVMGGLTGGIATSVASWTVGDPGRPYWFYGPEVQGHGRYQLQSAFDGTGIKPNRPF